MKSIFFTPLMLLSIKCVTAQNIFPSTGSVGIGTTTPAYTLDVNGSARFGGVLYSPSLVFQVYANNTSMTVGGEDITLDANHIGHIKLRTKNQSRLFIDNNGKIGIGTESPGMNLSFEDVYASENAVGISWYSGAGQTQSYAIYKTAGPWTAPNYQQMKLSWNTGIVLDPGTDYGKSYVDITGGGLRVTSGNVGIGTTTPTAQLHTNGTITFENYKNNVAEDKYLTTDVDGKLKLKTGSPGGGSSNWTVNGNNILNSNIGFVAIGTSTSFTPTDADLKLAVNGNIHAKKLKITQAAWADYVFHKNYPLLPLSKLEAYINQHQHLPEVPTTAEVEKNGIDVGDNQVLLLKKVEELTLYLIEQNKKIELLQQQNEDQQKQLNSLQKLNRTK